MFVLKKTIDVHGEGLKGAGSDALAADHSSLPELRSQADLDRSGTCSKPRSVGLIVFQHLNQVRLPRSFACRGRVQISSSHCSVACS